MPIDTALIGALHVEYLEEQGLKGDEHPHHTLFQTSTIEALLDGNYEGDVTFAELEEHGDFGLGTFDALDGEMICLDGEFYRVRADGRAYAVERGARTPFAVVTFFEPDLLLPLTDLEDFASLCAYLDREVGDRAVCHAVRVDGHFEYVKTRSVPRQNKPFPPLVEVVENQPTFEFRGLTRHDGGARGRREARRERVGRSPRLAECRSRRGRGSKVFRYLERVAQPDAATFVHRLCEAVKPT